MDALTFIVSVSENYPAAAMLLKWLAALIGTIMLLTSLLMVVRVNVVQTIDPSVMTTGTIIILFLISGATLSFAWTMNFVGDTFFDFGGYILNAFEGTEEWRVRNDVGPRRAMQQFTVLTCRVLGLLFGLWGLVSIFTAKMPNAQHGQQGGWIRLVVGAGFFHIIGTLDLFGGWGTKFLVN